MKSWPHWRLRWGQDFTLCASVPSLFKGDNNTSFLPPFVCLVYIDQKLFGTGTAIYYVHMQLAGPRGPRLSSGLQHYRHVNHINKKGLHSVKYVVTGHIQQDAPPAILEMIYEWAHINKIAFLCKMSWSNSVCTERCHVINTISSVDTFVSHPTES